MLAIALGILLATAPQPPVAPPPRVVIPVQVDSSKRQDLRAVVTKIAGDARPFLQQNVRVGEFVPHGPILNDPVGVPHELKHVLGDLIDPKATHVIRGTVRYVDVADVEGKVVLIEAVLEDTTTGKVVKTIAVPILYVPDVARFIGLNGVIVPGGQSGAARKTLEKLLQSPTAEVNKAGQVTASKQSQFSVEVRVTRGGLIGARPAALQEGMPFVKLAPGEVYEVKVQNHSPNEAAFRLSIDGLDLFAFHESKEKQLPTHVLLPPAKNGKPGETVVRGWFKSNGANGVTHEEFSLPAGVRRKPGTIVLSFFAVAPQPGVMQLVAGDDANVWNIEARNQVRKNIEPATEFVTIRFAR